VLEIGFGHKIPKLNFVSHLKLAKKIEGKIFMTKHTKKSGKTLISCLMDKIPYFRVVVL